MSHIVAVRRNPIYNDSQYREKCMQLVLHDANKYMSYDMKGVVQFLFPWVKDCPNQYYCSELVNHYAIMQSGNKQNLGGHSLIYEDRCTPWQIQQSKHLEPVEKVQGFYPIREMDYVLTTSDSQIAQLIKCVERGKDFEHDQWTASHAGIIVKMDGMYWIVEMVMGEGCIVSGIYKYEVR